MTGLAVSMERTNEIEEAASDWLIRRESGRWTQVDQARFDQWLDASTHHRVAFLRLELAWEESRRLEALGAGIAGIKVPPPGQWNLSPFFDASSAVSDELTEQRTSGSVLREGVTGPSRRRGRRLALAASVLLMLSIGLAGYQFWNADKDRYRTPVGGLASVPIPDGSKVTLNTNTEIRVAITEKQRRIDLRAGEVFFDVAKDPNRPFVVEAGKRRVIAVGTRFSVRRDGERIEVVVTEGTVRVENAAQSSSHGGAETSGSGTSPAGVDPPVLLVPGTIAFADEAGVLVQRTTVPEAETQLSWRSGVLTFRDDTLAEAVAEFNRYNKRKIVIADPAVAALKVEGNFRANNIDAFVRLLESGFPVRTSVDDEQIVLRSR